MSTISTHVIDTAEGEPVSGMALKLWRRDGDGWEELRDERTNVDGRVNALCPDGGVDPGLYKLWFDVAGHYSSLSVSTFYPEVTILFTVLHADEHYHVPLLLSPFGYTTYRGS